MTPLLIAATLGHTAIIALLLENNANIEVADNVSRCVVWVCMCVCVCVCVCVCADHAAASLRNFQ